jgi:hypothetical protein
VVVQQQGLGLEQPERPWTKKQPSSFAGSGALKCISHRSPIYFLKLDFTQVNAFQTEMLEHLTLQKGY